MATGLIIEKYKTDGNLHYYHVMPHEHKDFYICIDDEKKGLLFSHTINFEQTVGKMDFTQNQIMKEIPGIHFGSMIITWYQAHKAIQKKKNRLPQFISRES